MPPPRPIPTLAFALAASFTACSTAAAGDFATRANLGFSPDGGIFSFEEYGIQDGSGFPYAHIFFIDTAKDEWLPGTPIRVRIDEETATVEAARARAQKQAAPLRQRHAIAERGQVVASNPVTELSADPHNVEFIPRIVVPHIDDALTLALEEHSLPGEEICASFGETMGFALTLYSNGDSRPLHRDERIPENRSCPLSYSIADVITYYPQGAPPVLAVMVLMQKVGFEGPDGRFLAVTTRLD